MKDIKELISLMTTEEKASLCSGLNFWYLKGIERLEIPSIMVSDGPHGLRKQEKDPNEISLTDSTPATCFPTASALAATWNRDLIYSIGQALGEECKQEKVSVILGPGANIKRSPLCGRNFEYFSEDPYLSGEIARSHIDGVQSQGIGTSLKHFVANNQEYRRMTIDSIVDERALREIYLAGFEIAVKGAQPWTIMGSYNKVNGTYACEHSELLRAILKEEWKHEGLVITDWGAMNERVDALAAGLELEMPGINNGNDAMIGAAVESGHLDESILDDAVERILKLIQKSVESLKGDFNYDSQAHHSFARKVAGEGAVLLKNDQKILPLKNDQRIALIGDMAMNPRYQGAGSSLINPTRLDTIHAEIINIVGEDNLTYTPGYTTKGLEVDQTMIDEAVSLAKESEVVVICAGLPSSYEVEGLDRAHMKLPESHNNLIDAVSKVNDRIVVVLSNGSPVEMPWLEQVSGVLEGYLGGQAGGGALADILFGLTNPSGKLAETFPLKLEDNPSYNYFPGGPKSVEYRESIYVGYRFYDSVRKEVLFPFGHGLSYTEFEYSDIQISRSSMSDHEPIQVSLKVKNTGPFAGKEVIQLYINPLNPVVFRPMKELKGFEKIELKPGQEKEVSFVLEKRSFAYFNTSMKDWHVESGTYLIQIGASSRDIRLETEVQLKSSFPDAPISEQDRLPVYVSFPDDARISQKEFEKLLGRAVPENRVHETEIVTLNTALEDLSRFFIGRLLQMLVKRQVIKTVGDDPDSPTALLMFAMVKTMPLRLILMMGGDGFNREMLDALLEMLNGKIFRGLYNLLGGLRGRKQSPS